MSLLIDEYRKNWAIRYLREAESDLSTAERTPIEAMSVNFALIAMRKAQTSAYYLIGDPSYLAPLVNETLETRSASPSATMTLLTDIETFIRRCAGKGGSLNKVKTIREARALLKIVSKLITIMTRQRSIRSA
jgi:hypothetical protein